MGKMRRLLAAILVTSMLFGTNGVSYAAETIADSASQETAIEETTEAVTEEKEAVEPAGSDQSETTDAVTETSADDASQDGSEAVEEVSDTESDADNEAADNNAEAPESGSSTEAAAEATYSAGKLEFNGEDYGKDYSVTLSYDADAEIPADAQLKVTEIEKDKEPEKYEAYLKEANAAVKNSVTDARFFDIKIMVGDEEIQPKSAVKVSISYKEAIEVEEKAEVQAVHFDEKKDETVPVDIETNNGDKVDEVEFEAETFSVYAVLYTVDFNYTDHAFSMPGEGSILLSDLAEKLGFYAESETKEFSVQDVVNVTFTNSELVKTEKQEGGDWLLTSLKAFSTDETLTIDMANGDQFVVVVTDAQNALTINTSLYNYDDATAITFPENFCSDNVYAFVYVSVKDTEFKNLPDNTPWAVVDMNGIKGSNSPFTVNVDSFNNQPWGGGNVAYSSLTDEQKQNLRVRVIHTDSQPSLGGLKNMANYQQSAFEELWNGGFDGYAISTAHASGLTAPDNYEVNFIKGNTLEHDVTIKFNPTSDKGPIPAGKYYVLLDATSADGNNHYNYVVEVKTDGSEVSVNFPITENWSSSQPFSNNWKNITATVITPKAGKTITPGGNKPDAGDYDVSYMMGDYLYTYKGRVTETDDVNHIQHDEFAFELKKANFEPAIGPYDILGEGAEFGVVASTYIQRDHTETNFAAKRYENPKEKNIEIDGSGTGVIPFYAGEIIDHLWLSGANNIDSDIYVSDNYSSISRGHDHVSETIWDTTPSNVTVSVYPVTQETVNNKVDSLIKKLKDSSAEMASKNSIKVDFNNNDKTIDTTSLPDNKTIYIDASNINFGNGGYIIRKLPGQTIVFNIPGTDPVTIMDFSVVVVDGDTEKTVGSNSSGGGGYDQDREDVILDHIVFNAYETTLLEPKSGPAGLFLAPKGNVIENSGSGTGWIATGGTFDQVGSEWHFFRAKREYKSKGDFSLSGRKIIMEGENEREYSEFKSKTFTFKLYECDANGVIVKDAENKDKVLDTVTASSTEGTYGQFAFNKLKYTEADFAGDTADQDGKRTHTFYYVIKEDIPEGGKDDNVKYSAPPVYLKVEATDNPGVDGADGTISFKIFTSDGIKNSEQQVTWTEVPASGDADNNVYGIGDFANTVIGEHEITTNYVVTKTWNGSVPTSMPAGFDVKLYSVKTVDGQEVKTEVSAEKETDTDSNPWTITFKDLPAFTNEGEVIYYRAEEVCPEEYTQTGNNIVTTQYTLGEPTHPENIQPCNRTYLTLTSEYNLAYVVIKDGNNFYIWTQRETTPDEKNALDEVAKVVTSSFKKEQRQFWTGFGSFTGNGHQYDFSWTGGKVAIDFHNPSAWSFFGKGQFDSTYTPGSAAFANTCEAEGEIKAKKNFTGRTWKNGDSFEFTLEPVDGAPMPAGTTNNAKKITVSNGDAKTFGTITYSAVGTYKYTITETKENLPGVTYDTEPHEVTVTVAKGEDGNLAATVDYTEGEDAEEITNTFTSVKKHFEVTKELDFWGTAEQFRFKLAKVSPDNAPMPEETIAIAAKGDNPVAVFEELEFDAPGTYTYTITELDDHVPGVIYDTAPHTVTVKVDQNAETNELTATVTYDQNKSDLTITNTFEKANATLEATKAINDWGSAESFTFNLAAKNGAPLPKDPETGEVVTSRTVNKTDTSRKAVFGTIEYDAVGTYEYTITEVNDGVPGITYDTREHNVVVTVAKGTDSNALVATVKYDNEDSLTITNRYASATVTLEATKEIDYWGTAEKFTFNLAAVDGAPLPKDDEGNEVTSADATQQKPLATFGKIKYEEEGTFEYTITEQDDGEAGITYDTTPHKVVVTVKRNNDGDLEAEVKYDNKDSLTITNTFTSVKAQPEVTKAITEWGKATSFTFDLAAVDNAPMPEGSADGVKTVTVNKGQSPLKALFGEIEFKAVGEYSYTITEHNDGVDGITYDTEPHTVLIKVTKNEDTNALEAKVTYDGTKSSLTITNTFTAAEAELKATKDFNDWGKATSFTFELKTKSAADAEGNAISPIPEPASMTATATEEAKTASFGTIEYDQAGTYVYTITEQNGGVDGVSYDVTPHAVVVTVSKDEATNALTAEVKYDDADSLIITNTYTSTKATIEATKEFDSWGKADEFKFDLAAVTDGAPMPASTTATATKDAPLASFGEIEYEEAGTYEYTITEQNGGADGVTYDTTPHKVVVTVSKANDATNKLTAVVKYDDADSLTITNTYTSTKAELEATKQLNDWGTADSFTFTLEAKGDAPMPADAEGGKKSVDVTKNVTLAKFGEITYEKAGVYEYTITEEMGDADGVTYDTTAHAAVVTVAKDPETNALSATVKYDGKDTLIITNTYASSNVELQATKSFADWGKADSFTFTLKPVSKDAPMPEGTNEAGEKTATATQAVTTAKFGNIVYKKAGTFEYTITETDDGKDGVTYDTTPHKVVVTVTKDADNKLVAVAKYDDKDSLIITNTYEATKASLKATKSFEYWGKADSFTFDLEAVGNAPMPAGAADGKKSGIATKDTPVVNFGDITYEKAGTYEYTITEQNGGADGVTYDTTPHNVVVTVTKGEGNKLSAEVKYDDAESLTITNTYASTKAAIEATKDFEDWGKATEFKFDLAAVTEGAPMPASTTATATEQNPLASFGEITYEKAGVYEYTITEQNGGADGVTYDTTAHPVTVTVSKANDATNKLTATVTYGGAQSLTITNTYASTKATLEATKDFADWGKADEFKFDLAAVTEGAPMPASATATATKDAPIASFGEIEYEKAGVYEYTITEQNGGADGVTYDTTAHPVTVTVTKADDATNKLTATVKYGDAASLTITNTYSAVRTKLQATKDFNDWGKAESFTFELRAVDGAPMPLEGRVDGDVAYAVATKDSVDAVFGAIEFEKAGTYKYTITEVDDGVDGVTYDTTAHQVVVTVTKEEGTNRLVPAVKYDDKDKLVITNRFASASVTLQATKEFNDWGKAEDFTFTLKASKPADAPMPEKTVVKATGDAQTAVFGSVTYDKAGTYEYTITETDDGIEGVTYDTTPHKAVVTVTKDADNKLVAEVKYDGENSLVITNTYEAVKAELEVTKAFSDWGKADSFTFDLAAVDGAPLPASTTATATETKKTVSFGEITFEKAGTYEYTITERNGEADGVTYDVTPHKAVVTVTKGEGNKLSASVKYDDKDSLIVTNTYAATEAELKATKEFNDWGKADSFTFKLEAVTEGAPMPEETTVTATEDAPEATFGNITFEKQGTYKYTITEINDGKDGVTYDTTPHNVTVTVTKAADATNALTATVKYDDKDSLIITNTYEATSAELKATKEFNDWGKADSFTFNLAAVTKDAPMPAETSATATEDAPEVSFGNITFEKAGTYEYTITEVNDGVDGVTYDTTAHKAVVTVSKEEGTNKLSASVKYDGKDSLIITNTFTAAEATLEATKSFNDWGKAESFTFDLAAVTEGAPMPEDTEAVATKENVNAVFGKVTYDKAGTYEYTITERNDGADGVTYDTTAHKVKVEVAKADDATNALTATVTYDGDATLIVTNTYASTSVTLQATKEFSDWGKADSFTFDLAAVTEGAPMPKNKVATATENAKTAVFGSVEYEKTGKYEYTITERNDGVDGVTYDTKAHKVVVDVTKDADNKMIARATYDGKSSLIITNTFTAAKANFEATKEFNDWGKADSFTFDLEAVTDGAPMPTETTATATEGKKAVFGEMEFDKAGTYEYTITEQNGGADGVSYDVTPHNATVVVTKDEQTNELSAEVTYGGEKELIITNTFTAAIAHVEATKVLEDRDWFNADEFEFELAAVTEGAPMPEAKTAKATKDKPTAVFGDMEFVKAGTYHYTITEKDGERKGITYDTEPHGVTVTVSKAEDATNALTAVVAYDGKDELKITNTYASEGSVDLKVKKALEGRPLENKQFTFELYDENGLLRTATNDSKGLVEFEAIHYTQEDIKVWDAETGTGTGEKKYTVKEKVTDPKTGYTYDKSEIEITVSLTDDGEGTITAAAKPELKDLVFTNTYEAKGEITLKAKKELRGERALKEGDFSFVLTYPDGTTQVKSNGADGTVTFDKIEYTQDDIYEKNAETGAYKLKDKTSYEYTIQEKIPKDAVKQEDGTYVYKGYTYDGTVYTVTVELTDNGDGTITATDTSGQSEYVFTNAYDADGTLKLDAEKTFKNGTLKGGEFTFELMGADGKVLQSRTNDAAGNVSFGLITYSMKDLKDSPFTYTVREVRGSRTDVKYDATVYTVTVELEDNGDGTLKVTKTVDNGGELKFVNEQLNVETTVTIGGEKVLKGRKLKEGEFKFVLADENGKWVDTATNDANGNFTFKPITYKLFDLKGEKSKVYTYGISEVKGSDSGIIYDKKVYTVKVTVTDNGDGTMTAKADMARGDIRFVNTTSDKTGDEAPLGVLFGGLGFGVAGLAVLLEDRKRRNRNK